MGIQQSVSKKNKALLLFLLAFLSLSAQHFAPVSTGYYSGIHGAWLNPALPAYTKYNWHINLIGGWVNINNNYVHTNFPFSAYKFRNNSKVPTQYKNADGSIKYDTNWLIEKLNGRAKHASAGGIIYGPSFTVKIKNLSVGAVSQFVALGRIHGVDEKLAHAAYKGFDTLRGAFNMFATGTGTSNSIHKLATHYGTYMGVGLNVAYNIPVKWAQNVLVGITPKKIWGFGGGYFYTDKFTETNVNPDSIKIDKLNVKYMDFTGRGRGAGVDIGAVYVYKKPEFRQPGGYAKKHTMYQYKFGFSILDIGSIKYKDATTVAINSNSPVGWNVQAEKNKLNNGNVQFSDIYGYVTGLPNYKETVSDVRIGLPTRMVLFADYMVKSRWFVNMHLVQSLRGRYGKNMRQPSYLMVGPRYERDWFEVSVPMYLEYDYRAFRMGAAFRVGPLYFGSNSVMSLLYARRTRDADFFIGIAFGDLPGKFKKRVEDNQDERRKEKEKKQKAKDCEKM